MSIHIKLKPERTPCWDTEITKPIDSVNKIEIIVEAFALIGFNECPSSLFIMPGLVSIADFHGREDMDETFRLPDPRLSLLNGAQGACLTS
jgi:hypothetical protein